MARPPPPLRAVAPHAPPEPRRTAMRTTVVLRTTVVRGSNRGRCPWQLCKLVSEDRTLAFPCFGVFEPPPGQSPERMRNHVQFSAY